MGRMMVDWDDGLEKDVQEVLGVILVAGCQDHGDPCMALLDDFIL